MLLRIREPSGTCHKVRCEPSISYADLIAEVEKQCRWDGEAGTLRLSLNNKDPLELAQKGKLASVGIRRDELLYIIEDTPTIAPAPAPPAPSAPPPSIDSASPSKVPSPISTPGGAASPPPAAPATTSCISSTSPVPTSCVDVDDVMQQLSNEVLVHICAFLLPRELGTLACTSRCFGCATAWHASSNGAKHSVVEEAARRWVLARLAEGATRPACNGHVSWLRQMHTLIMAKHPDESFSDHFARQRTGLSHSDFQAKKNAKAQAKVEAEERRMQDPRYRAELIVLEREFWAEAQKDFDDDMMAGQYDKWFPVTHWFDKRQAFTDKEAFIRAHGQEVYDAVVLLWPNGFQ